jgi:hypothetical protein
VEFENLIPKRGNRVFLSGMTGSGKSVLARYLLGSRQQDLVLIYDAKDEIFWPGYYRYTKLSRLIGDNPRRAIYAPNIHELDDSEKHDQFFKWAFLRQKKNRKKKLTVNTIVYVDEAYAVTDGQQLPFYYKAGLTRGRSIGLEIWSATQRPKDIPQFLMSESEQKYLFFHMMPQDKDKLSKMVGVDIALVDSLSMENHEFAYVNINRISGKLKLKLKRS